MKIIDLLNKIANGEEVPKKIKINNIIYEYQGDDYLFKDKNNDNHEYWLFSAGYTDKFQWLDSFLKTKIEIIEEETKPLTKQDVEALGYACGEIRKCFVNGWNKSLENKPFKEDKKIEKINYIPINYADDRKPEEVYEYLRCTINNLANVINVSNENLFELIDRVNSLENK